MKLISILICTCHHYRKRSYHCVKLAIKVRLIRRRANKHGFRYRFRSLFRFCMNISREKERKRIVHLLQRLDATGDRWIHLPWCSALSFYESRMSETNATRRLPSCFSRNILLDRKLRGPRIAASGCTAAHLPLVIKRARDLSAHVPVIQPMLRNATIWKENIEYLSIILLKNEICNNINLYSKNSNNLTR